MSSVHDELQKQLDTVFFAVDDEWDSPMLFSLHLGLDCATNTTTYPIEICKFISGQSIADCPVSLAGDFAYFSRADFPPPASDLGTIRDL